MRRLNLPRRPCDVENIEDFQRYYAQAYLGFHEDDGTIMPVSVTTDGRAVMATRLVDTRGILGNAIALSWTEARDKLSFGIPPMGMVNCGSTIVYLYGYSTRQAHRGYRPATPRLVTFNSWALRNKEPQNANPTPSDFEIVRQLFSPVYYDTKEALNLFNEGERVGCAISRFLGLYITEKSPNAVIAWRRSAVGYIDKDVAYLTNSHVELVKNISDTLEMPVTLL